MAVSSIPTRLHSYQSLVDDPSELDVLCDSKTPPSMIINKSSKALSWYTNPPTPNEIKRKSIRGSSFASVKRSGLGFRNRIHWNLSHCRRAVYTGQGQLRHVLRLAPATASKGHQQQNTPVRKVQEDLEPLLFVPTSHKDREPQLSDDEMALLERLHCSQLAILSKLFSEKVSESTHCL